MPRRRGPWKNKGIATHVDITGNRVPIRVGRPTLEIRKQAGANIRVRDLPGGYKGIFVGNNEQGQRIRTPPAFDREIEMARMERFLQRSYDKLGAGMENFEQQVQKRAWEHPLLHRHNIEEPTRLTLWKFWMPHWIGWKGMKFMDNVRLKLLTPFRKRRMLRDLAIAREAERRLHTGDTAKRINAGYAATLHEAVNDLHAHNEKMWEAYNSIGKKGGISPQQYERMLIEYHQHERAYEAKVGEGGNAHVKYDELVSNLGQRALKKVENIEAELKRPRLPAQKEFSAAPGKPESDNRLKRQIAAAETRLQARLAKRRKQRERVE